MGSRALMARSHCTTRFVIPDALYLQCARVGVSTAGHIPSIRRRSSMDVLSSEDLEKHGSMVMPVSLRTWKCDYSSPVSEPTCSLCRWAYWDFMILVVYGIKTTKVMIPRRFQDARTYGIGHGVEASG